MQGNLVGAPTYGDSVVLDSTPARQLLPGLIFSSHVKYMGRKCCLSSGHRTVETEEMAHYFLRWRRYTGIVALLLFCLGRKNLFKI